MQHSVAIVGRGRVGSALGAALTDAGVHVVAVLGRGDPLPPDADLVILAVPDAAIASAAQVIPQGPLLAHCSASAPLSVLGAREAFILHPLLAVTGAGTVFAGAGCAVSGNSPRALAAARDLARVLGMRVAEVRDEDRALYHAAASLASNFLVTLEGEAERLMAIAGIERALLAPLVQGAVEAWVHRGATEALTGPIVRGDTATVQRQRDAVEQRAPELLPMWDALAERTRVLAASANAARGGAAVRSQGAA